MFGLELLITDGCNKKCSYCIRRHSSNMMSFETATTIIDKALLNSKFNKAVSLFGGEPTLNIDLMNRLIDHYGDRIWFSTITNGNYMNIKNGIDVINKLGSIHISIELTETAYNAFRGSSDVRSLILSTKDLKCRRIVFNASYNGLIFDDVDEMKENIKLIEELGHELHIYHMKANYDGFSNDMNDYINKFIMMRDIYPDFFNNIVNNYKDKYFSLNPIQKCNNVCSMDGMITISPDGIILPCSYSKENDGYNVFDVDYKDLDSIMDNHIKTYGTYKIWDKCKTCFVPTALCRASCPFIMRDVDKNGSTDIICERERLLYLLINTTEFENIEGVCKDE